MSFMNLLETQDSILLAVDKQDDAKQKQIEKNLGLIRLIYLCPPRPKNRKLIFHRRKRFSYFFLLSGVKLCSGKELK